MPHVQPTPSTTISTSTFSVCVLSSTRLPTRVWRPRHNRFAAGTGSAVRSRRLTVTPGDLRCVAPDPRFSSHRFTPMSHNANAWSAVVLPALFGPISTTSWPRSSDTSSNSLKFRTVSRVSILDSSSRTPGSTPGCSRRYTLPPCARRRARDREPRCRRNRPRRVCA